jgi:hypothetical protein
LGGLSIIVSLLFLVKKGVNVSQNIYHKEQNHWSIFLSHFGSTHVHGLHKTSISVGPLSSLGLDEWSLTRNLVQRMRQNSCIVLSQNVKVKFTCDHW